MKFIYNYVDLWIVTKNIFMEQLAGFDIIKNALIKTRPTISTIVKEEVGVLYSDLNILYRFLIISNNDKETKSKIQVML